MTHPYDTAAIFTEHYYSDKAREFGATPFGVDWSCVATQQMRFAQLLRVCDLTRPFRLNDFGCGYGALLDYTAAVHATDDIDYAGVDLSPEMIGLAHRQHPSRVGIFRVGAIPSRVACYTVSSGIFNVQFDQTTPEWEQVVEATLEHIAAASSRGFAVNFLLPRTESTGRGCTLGGRLYTSLPERWGCYCRLRFGAAVEVVTGYGLAEFTLLVRPSDPFRPTSAWARSSSGR